MKLVFFVHPSFLKQQSMPRFARLLTEGMKQRGHQVEIWTPKSRFFKLSKSRLFSKWLGYIDQYIVFPSEVRNRLKYCPSDTLFIITDNALGPWVPLIVDRPHVIHCHDFLAQYSALGKIPENPTSWTGRQYQAFIHKGYSQGKHFISVSEKTRYDLLQFLPSNPYNSYVVYNALNQQFDQKIPREARIQFCKEIGIDIKDGYLLHVGGNQWYKNRKGVIEIYDTFRLAHECKMPLLMVGPQPTTILKERALQSPFANDIHFLSNLEDQSVRLAYMGGSLLLYPSLAEGFGWPIAEAMAAGCPVITTNEAPMTEVAGKAGFFIQRRPTKIDEVNKWAMESAKVVNAVLELTPEDRDKVIKDGFENVCRFDPDSYIERMESIYQSILDHITEPQ